MPLSINTNAAALGTHNALAASNSALASSINKLSTGYKINSAADDPAGLVISENLRAQMSGITQAVANSQDGVNLMKTAEGALTQVNTLLKSMRSLAVHAANAGANSASSVAADQSQIASAITSLNNISANTAFGNQKLLDGSGAVNVTNLNTTDVASITAASSGSAFAPSGVAGNITVNVTSAASKASVTLDTAFAAGSAGTVTINGVGINIGAADTLDQAVAKINLASDQTGVTASNNAGKLQLDQQSAGSDKLIAYSEAGVDFNGGAASVTAGTNAAATVTVNGVASTFTSGKGNVLQNAAGDKITLTTGTGVGDLGVVGYAAGKGLTFQIGANAGETATVSIGSSAANKLGGGTGTSFADLSQIDVTTNASDAIKVIDAAIAQVATQRADLGAFQKNVLESNISSLNVTNENVTASESSVRDTDMAAEMTNFTRLNIMAQAGIAMLTQANQQPQQLLSLLK